MTGQKKSSIQQRWNDLQPSKTMLFWSCASSVVVALVVGFTWGGWVTGGTARDMAETAGDTSRYELASVICVEKFLAAPDAQAQLTELKAIDSSYRQRQFIEAGGYRTERWWAPDAWQWIRSESIAPKTLRPPQPDNHIALRDDSANVLPTAASNDCAPVA